MAVTEASTTRLVLRQPRIQRPGLKFNPIAEAQLEPHARDAIKRLPGAHRGVIAVREAPGPLGVPDFVALVGNRSKIQARSKLGARPLRNEVDARLAAAAPTQGGASLDELARATGLPLGVAQRRTGQLVRSGALLRSAKGKIRRPAALRALGHLYAVEMKVSDWRRALDQCRRYHVWADCYVLVMGPLSEGQIEKVSDCVSSDDAGLSIDGVPICKPKPQPDKPEWQRLLASEHFFATTSYAPQPSDSP